MKKIKVNTAEGLALNWLAAKAAGALFPLGNVKRVAGKLFLAVGGEIDLNDEHAVYDPVNDWSQAGALLEDEGIALWCNHKAVPGAKDPSWRFDSWRAAYRQKEDEPAYGPTARIAILRCYVTQRLGETVEVPDEVLNPPKDSQAEQAAALALLQKALTKATDSGLFDEMAAFKHPDTINGFCDLVAQVAGGPTSAERPRG